MKRQTSLTAFLGTAAALLAATAQVSLAQAPADPGAAITNESTTTTTATTTTATVPEFAVTETQTETLPDTGGAPLLMALAGALTAGGAFCLRRKIS